MIKKAKRPRKDHLKVKYAEANRIRSLLLSEDVQMLSKRDVQTILKILDDVYPVRKRQPKSPVWVRPKSERAVDIGEQKVRALAARLRERLSE